MTTRKPPQFKHHPPARAKALKKAWVEKAKIKSKWKTERRKLGFTSIVAHGDDDDSNQHDKSAEPHIDEAPISHAQMAENAPKPQREDDGPDLREMTKQAFSRSSLHTSSTSETWS
ncbi:hypothetical protein VKT23_004115 [Stygiomarasmius scandens]|uniref:Uncharacterized protein n=1 Tax=Marasmiellus scandens TaxID=2682957 RepID=A0ABR1JUQ2_9AGAR